MHVNVRGVSRSCFLVLAAMATSAPGLAQADIAVLRDLQRYGRAVAGSAQPGALQFEEAMQTMEQPMRAFKLTFETSSPALLKSPNAEKDRVAFLENSGKAELWQRKFCSKDLIPLMVRHGLGLVSGQLRDSRGEIQSLAICPRSQVEGVPIRKEVEPALEFEDGEARSWLDRPPSRDGDFWIIAIKREAGSYVMYRVGRDQVLERVNIRRAGARFLVPGDRQGAYFILRSDGLGICDARGCSRIAKAQEMPDSNRDEGIAAQTDERASEIEAQTKIRIWSDEPVEGGGKSLMTGRTPEPVIDPAKRAEIAKWFSESLPSLRALGRILSSVQSQKKDIRISSTERVRFCNEALATPASDLGTSGDSELDATVLSLRSKAHEALRICASGNDLGAQVLVGQAMDLSFRLDGRLRALGIVAP